MEFNLPEDLALPTLLETRRFTPNFAIEMPTNFDQLGDAFLKSFLDTPPLPPCAGGRQRNQLRREGLYPKGNEPKPWSKRSRKKINATR